jgi:NADH-quinone oxidoreductase subunit M
MLPEGVAEYGTWALVLACHQCVVCFGNGHRAEEFQIVDRLFFHRSLGVLTAGILAGNAQGVQGGVMEMLSHGIITVGLFIVYDIIESRMSHDDMSKMGGIRDVNPHLHFCFL